MFDFSNVKARTKKNERAKGGFAGRKARSFDIKYQVSQKSKKFVFGLAWEEYDLQNNGIVNYPPHQGVIACLVYPQEHKEVTIFGVPKGEKSREFTANVLERDLREVGVLEEVNQEEIVKSKPSIQYLTAQKLDKDQELPEGAIAGFIILKAEDQEEESSEVESDTPNNVETPEPSSTVEEVEEELVDPDEF